MLSIISMLRGLMRLVINTDMGQFNNDAHLVLVFYF